MYEHRTEDRHPAFAGNNVCGDDRPLPDERLAAHEFQQKNQRVHQNDRKRPFQTVIETIDLIVSTMVASWTGCAIGLVGFCGSTGLANGTFQGRSSSMRWMGWSAMRGSRSFELGGSNQAVHGRGILAAGIGSLEKIILSSERHRP
jgi:hypothetical protein